MIAISASAFEDQKEDALAVGCDDFIAKPFKDYELFNIMQKHLELSFICEAISSSDYAHPNKQNQQISTEQLKDLPQEWKSRMKEAIQHGDLDQMYKLVEQQRKRDEMIAEAIQQRIDRFEYETVLAALE